tara:strand:- start:713 stop:979 length:267 start_codon:yes stop_codon:yes gene_type:complete
MFNNIIFSIIISTINTIIYAFMNKNIHLQNKYKDYGIFFSLTFMVTFIGIMFFSSDNTNISNDISGGSSITTSTNVGLKINNSSKPPF